MTQNVWSNHRPDMDPKEKRPSAIGDGCYGYLLTRTLVLFLSFDLLKYIGLTMHTYVCVKNSILWSTHTFDFTSDFLHFFSRALF